MSALFKSQPSTTTTRVELSPEQRELYALAMPGFREYAANPPARYQGPTTAGFDPWQVQAQDTALGAVGAQQTLANNAASASNFLTSGEVFSPASNPHLSGAIDAAVRPLYENLTYNALPNIRGEAVKTGNFGSTRQGIAEGMAVNSTQQAAGDTAAKMSNANYQAGLDSMLKALSLTPQTQQTQLAPSLTMSGVGDVRQQQAQTELNANIAGFNYDQLLPFMAARDIAAIASGMPSAGATSSSPNATSNPIMQGLGLGMTGLSLASSLAPAAASAASSITPLLALLSERWLKTNIEKLATMANGLGVYRFEYIGFPFKFVGFMVDEVAKLRPEAVRKIGMARAVVPSLAMR